MTDLIAVAGDDVPVTSAIPGSASLFINTTAGVRRTDRNGLLAYLGMGDVSTVQFATREEFVLAAAAFNLGQKVLAGNRIYVKDGGIDIADLPGWSPFDLITPEHWKTNVTPGTTPMGAAINAAVIHASRVGGNVYLDGKLYLSEVQIVGKRGVTVCGATPSFSNDYVDDGLVLKGTWLCVDAGFNDDLVYFTADPADFAAGYPRLHAGLRHIGIHGNRTAEWDLSDFSNNTSGSGVVIDGASYVHLDDVIILRCAEYGVLMQSRDYGGSIGIRTSNNCTFDVVSLQNGLDGARLFGGDGTVKRLICGANGRDGYNGNMGPLGLHRLWNNVRYGAALQGGSVVEGAGPLEGGALGFGMSLGNGEIYDNGDAGVAFLSGSGCIIATSERLYDNSRAVADGGNVFVSENAGKCAYYAGFNGVVNGRFRISSPTTGFTPGSGYVDGTYNGVPLTGGTGTGATSDFVVAGGVVTACTYNNRGTGYTVNDVLGVSNANLGGSGSGFAVTVTITGYPFAYNTTYGVRSTSGAPDIVIGQGQFQGVIPYSFSNMSRVRAEGREPGSVSVTLFGAKGDGVTDDTLACQTAHNLCPHVHYPRTDAFYRVSAEINLPLNNARVTGDGEQSQVRQVTGALNVFVATNRTGITITGVHARATGSISSTVNGGGVLFSGCTDCNATGIIVSNHRGAGVNLNNSDYCLVSHCRFKDSPVAHLDPNSQCLADIAVQRGSKGNIVTENFCLSGQGTGVHVQSIDATNEADRNVVTNNVIREAKAYGIIAYRVNDGADGQSVFGTVISGNAIETVYGTIYNVVAANYSFGAGIYIQGAEDSVVTGNTISGTHAGASIIAPAVFADTLAPGAIGCTNVSRFTVTGNAIKNAGRCGIDVGDPLTTGETTDFGVVSNNTVDGVVLHGLRSRQRGNLKIHGNGFSDIGGVGLYIQNTAGHNEIEIVNNAFDGITSHIIQLAYITRGRVAGNSGTGGGIHGITAANCNHVSIEHNRMYGVASRAYQIESSCGAGMKLLSNAAIAGASSAEAYRISAKCRIDGHNTADGTFSSGAWNGDFVWMRGIRDDSGVGVSGASETNLRSLSIAASTLTATGEAVRIVAGGTTANNSNTKTLRVYFGATVIATFTLTPSQVSDWEVDATVSRRATSAQRATVRLIQGGTVKQIDFDASDITETETSALTFRITGQGVANSDITKTTAKIEWVDAA